MKKRLSIYFFMLFMALPLFAQKDVTTFLGIPVDGFKPEMKKKLIAKGFTPKVVGGTEFLEGEFNGTDVNVFIATNNNKVYRIMLCDKNHINEADVKIRFNKLVSQFTNNKRYISLSEQTIDDNVDISYEMKVKNKRFEAAFFQAPNMDKLDTLALRKAVYDDMLGSYSKEELDHPTEEIGKVIIEKTLNYASEFIKKKSVWFMISESYGDYYITMYYDNGYNQAQGEDL